VMDILLGGHSTKQGEQLFLNAAMANRHGMIAGATGTGKTVTLQILAEGFSKMGVPVFLADIKGDLSGLSQAGTNNKIVQQRISHIAINDFQHQPNPTVFWDIFAKQGHPVRTTISEMGPLLLSSLLELNDTQTGILYSCFKIADDSGLLLLDLKDLRSMLSWMGENKNQIKNDYGNVSSASIGAIQRRLLVLEEQGAEYFFGEPALNLDDLCKVDFSGNGIISLLDATKLASQSPRLYAIFLLWLLSETYENFPEVGDIDKPKLVMFFDEAHLLFDRAPRVLIDKIEQVVRLIRSKGVGIYFISQSPLDVPEAILGQLGMKIQHALRAFTPKEKKVVNTVADTFRSNPDLDTRKVITELEIGEALVSVLDHKASPTPVQRILIRPPQSQIGPISDTQRSTLVSRSPFHGKYEQDIDRESAYELLKQRADELLKQQEQEKEQQQAEKSKPKVRSSNRQSVAEAMFKSVARSIGSQLGRQIIRGVLGSLGFGKR
jgi:DNA double-strand break repair helicase HerA and related ATPase